MACFDIHKLEMLNSVDPKVITCILNTKNSDFFCSFHYPNGYF